jgi:hypothetical protein
MRGAVPAKGAGLMGVSTQSREDPIDSVIAQLESLVAVSMAKGDRIGYFAALYLRVTRTIRSKIGTGYFDDDARMMRLDRAFATRYLTAVDGFRRGDRAISPAWTVAFEAASREDLVIVQHLLLGMAPHIGIDLAVAAGQTCPGSQIDALHADFLRINAILASVVPTVIAELSDVSPWMHLLADLAEDGEVSIIDFGLAEVRDSSWIAAYGLAGMSADEQDAWIATDTPAVVTLERDLLVPDVIVRGVLDTVRSAEAKDVRRVIEALSTRDPIPDTLIAATAAGKASLRTALHSRIAMLREPVAPAAHANRVYYFEVAPGRWSGSFSFEIASWQRLWTSRMSLKNKLLASAMGLFVQLFGGATLTSELKPFPKRGQAGLAINEIVIRSAWFTLWRSHETYTLGADGRRVHVEARVSFGPLAFLFPEYDVYPATVFDGGMRTLYRIKLLGSRILGRYEVQPGRLQVRSTLTNSWLIAREVLDRVQAPPSPPAS